MGDGSSSQPEFIRPCIFKVHDGLRANADGKPDPYTPMLVSIGPYHSRDSKLEAMNKYKQLYVDSLLKPGNVVEECKSKLADIECKRRAPQYYADPPESTDEFVNMMLRDGCFIIGFLCRMTKDDSGDPLQQNLETDSLYPIMDVDWKISHICRDMMLLENQLPYFVLDTLYDTIVLAKERQQSGTPDWQEQQRSTREKRKQSLWRKVILTFNCMLPKPRRRFIELHQIGTQEIKHLLHAAHIICRHDLPVKIPDQQNTAENKDQPLKQPLIGSTKVPERIGTVVELQQYGVNFKKIGEVYKGNDLIKADGRPPAGGSCAFWVSIINKISLCLSKKESSADDVSLFDIKFEDGGSMRIPCFKVEDSTETLFRNLIAYEQHSSDKDNYFTDFTTFMDQLINSEKDVKILRVNGIIVNLLGDDKKVSDLFNRLNDGVIESRNSYYGGVSQDVINYCEPNWIRFKAMLKRKYFGNPWAIISTGAAVLLLILAIAQTVLALLTLLK